LTSRGSSGAGAQVTLSRPGLDAAAFDLWSAASRRHPRTVVATIGDVDPWMSGGHHFLDLTVRRS